MPFDADRPGGATLRMQYSRRMAMHKVVTLSMIVAMALLALPSARAGSIEDSDREAARIATKQATAAFNLGHYDEAASLYEDAYKHVPDPVLLYNLGQSYRQADKLDKALIAYRSYLRTAPEDAPNRERVSKLIDELERASDLQKKTAAQKAAQKEPVVAPAAPPTVPPTVFPAVPEPKPAEPQVLPQQISPPRTSTRSDLIVEAPKTESPHSSGSWKQWVPWVGVGVTALLGAATVVEGLSARSSFSNLQGTCGKTRTCTDSQVIGAKSKATTTNVLLGLTAASAAATGVVFYFSFSGGETGASLAWRY
jgi:hypothetical protein